MSVGKLGTFFSHRMRAKTEEQDKAVRASVHLKRKAAPVYSHYYCCGDAVDFVGAAGYASLVQAHSFNASDTATLPNFAVNPAPFAVNNTINNTLLTTNILLLSFLSPANPRAQKL